MDRPFATTCSLGKGMTACFKRSGYFETKPERRADVSSANGDVKLHDSPVCPEGAANYCRVEAERDAVVEELKEYPALARLDVCTWRDPSVPAAARVGPEVGVELPMVRAGH